MSPAGRNTLSKEERINGKKSIGALLEAGRWISVPPVKCCFSVPNTQGFSRIMVSVPKKSFKRAVRRNYLKRIIRESYRTQKGLLGGINADMLFIYEGRNICTYLQMKDTIAGILEKIASTASDVQA